MKTRTLLSLIAIMLLFSFRSLATPTNSVSISASPGDTICSGESVTFTASVTGTYGSGTYGYSWNVNGTFVGTSSPTYTSTTLANGNQVHCVITNAIGDTIYALSDTITMTVNPAPVPAPITGVDSVCAGSSVQLSDTTSGGVWYVSNNTVATVSGTGLVTGITAPTGGGGGGGGGSIRVYYKTTTGCGTDSVNIRFYVRNPATSIAASATSMCIDSAINLSDGTTGGAWTSSNSSTAGFPAFAFGQETLTGNAAGSVTITYAGDNACGVYSKTIDITVVNCDTTVIGAGVKQINSLAEGCNIYPNPSTGSSTVMVRSARYSQVNCVISNMVGEKVKTLTLNTNQENVVDMGASPGIYFITISAGNEKYTSKMVVIQ